MPTINISDAEKFQDYDVDTFLLVAIDTAGRPCVVTNTTNILEISGLCKVMEASFQQSVNVSKF